MKTHTFKGHTFKLVEGTTHPAYSFDTFDKEERDIRERYWDIQPGEVVIDVGASYGSYALTAAACGATVYAFEPEPTVFVDLVRNVEANNWQERVFPFRLALSDQRGTVNMHEYAPHWPSQTITDVYRTETLDQMVKDTIELTIDWLKIDVEGLEEKVIAGGLEAIKANAPNLLIECHNFLDPKISERVKAMLPDYQFEEINRDPCITLFGTK